MKRAILAVIPWALLLFLGLAEFNFESPKPCRTGAVCFWAGEFSTDVATITPTEIPWPTLPTRTLGPTKTPCPLCTPVPTPTLALPPTESPPISYPPSSPMPSGYPGMVWLPIIVAPPFSGPPVSYP